MVPWRGRSYSSVRALSGDRGALRGWERTSPSVERPSVRSHGRGKSAGAASPAVAGEASSASSYGDHSRILPGNARASLRQGKDRAASQPSSSQDEIHPPAKKAAKLTSMPPPGPSPGRAASTPSPSPWRQPKVPPVGERAADKAEARRYDGSSKPVGKRPLKPGITARSRGPSEPEPLDDDEGWIDGEEVDAEDEGGWAMEERDAFDYWGRMGEEEKDAASEMADGHGWDRDDTQSRGPRTMGAALNTNVKAVYVNEHVDAFDLLFALLVDKTIVILLFFESTAVDSLIHQGLVSIGYTGVSTSRWTVGFKKMLAELAEQRHCVFALDPCVLFLPRSSHVEDISVGESLWTEDGRIGTNHVSFNHHNNQMDCPFAIGVSSVHSDVEVSDWDEELFQDAMVEMLIEERCRLLFCYFGDALAPPRSRGGALSCKRADWL